MTEPVNVHAAKTHLSRLIKRVEAGDEVVISRGGVPVAKLVPVEGARERVPGRLKGAIRIGADFEEALPEDLWSSGI